MSQAGWRKWHRWVGFAAAPFLLFAALTGIVAGVAEMTSEDEEAREKARERVSEVKLPASPAAVSHPPFAKAPWEIDDPYAVNNALAWRAVSQPSAKAVDAAAAKAPGAPVDKVLIDFKADPPTVTVYLGKPTGGEDKKLVYDARSGEFLREENYEDKPFLTRVHSGEAFGDGGLLLGTAWGLALLVLLVSGLVIYLAMRKPDRKGLGKLFW